MRNIHPITTFSLGFNLLAVVLGVAGFPFIAAVVCVLTFFATFLEVQRYTSIYQFLIIYLACFLSGFFLDLELNSLPFFTVSTMLAATGCILRFILFRYFTFMRFLWLEPVLLLSSAAFAIGGCIQTGYWPSLFITFPFIVSGILLSITFTRDKNQLLARGARGLAIGNEAADFELPDQDGKLVQLSSFRNKRHVLLIFVRGDWCPCCHMMLRTYEKNNNVFRSKNIMVMAIGPDPVGVNRKMVERLGLDYKVLSDTGQKTAQRYGVQVKEFENTFADEYQEGLPLPASFLIDDRGIVRYVSRPDKVGEFLNPSLIFPIVEQLK